MSESTYEVHPPTARWTHIALRVNDIDATIDWYSEFTPMELLDRREDDDGYGAWLGMPDAVEQPFILVVAQFFEHRDPFKDAPHATLAPFAHIGIEMPTRDDIDQIAVKGSAADCLGMPPTQMPAPIGYICMLRDPDGNMVEYSWDQGVYTTVQEKWGA
jgi:lactoylglutathione lyase